MCERATEDFLGPVNASKIGEASLCRAGLNTIFVEFVHPPSTNSTNM
jgi:hypothetical protein